MGRFPLKNATERRAIPGEWDEVVVIKFKLIVGQGLIDQSVSKVICCRRVGCI